MTKDEYDDWVRFNVSKACENNGPTYTTEEVRAHLKAGMKRWPIEKKLRKTYDIPLEGTLLLHGIPKHAQSGAAAAAEWLGFELEHILLRFLYHVSFDPRKPFHLYFAKDVSKDSENPNEITLAAMRECEEHPELLRSGSIDDVLKDAEEHHAKVEALLATLPEDDLLIDGISDWEIDLVKKNAKEIGFTIGELVYKFILQFEHLPLDTFYCDKPLPKI